MEPEVRSEIHVVQGVSSNEGNDCRYSVAHVAVGVVKLYWAYAEQSIVDLTYHVEFPNRLRFEHVEFLCYGGLAPSQCCRVATTETVSSIKWYVVALVSIV